MTDGEEQPTIILCFQTDWGIPIHISSNFLQTLKNEVGLDIVWDGRESIRM